MLIDKSNPTLFTCVKCEDKEEFDNVRYFLYWSSVNTYTCENCFTRFKMVDDDPYIFEEIK